MKHIPKNKKILPVKKSKRHIMFLLGAVVSVVSFFAACNSDDPGIDNRPNLRELSLAEEKIIEAANPFVFDIFSKINENHPGENVFISPFSISTALSMTLNGASGETLEAMKSTLGTSEMNAEEINAAYSDLVDLLLTLDKTVKLQVANSNWYRNDLTINPEFEATLKKYYDAEGKSADFGDGKTVDLINSWIENKTEGKIKDMLDYIPSDAVMYLINAIYFKAEWKYQFEKNKTQDRAFHLADGSTIDVPTMYANGVVVNLSSKNGISLIDIPYGNGQFNFTIIMPNGYSEDIDELISKFTEAEFNDLMEDTTSRSIELYLPKLKVEFKEELTDVLTDMGMGVAFSDTADFSNLLQENLSLAISRILHQSFLEVNEQGTEAAAATVVEIVEMSSGGLPPSIQIDRPFAFFIREKHSNAILFAGKISNPI